MKRDDEDRFGKNLDLLVSNYKKAINLAFTENIDDPAGFHKRCAALRAEFDTWAKAEKQTEMARIENEHRKGTTSLESPGMAEADRSARYHDNSSGGMRTPRNAGTTSLSGFGLERSSYDEDEGLEPTDDDGDLEHEMDEGDRAYTKLARKGARVARRDGLTPEQGFLRVYESPKNSALVTLTKVRRAPVSQESEDAYTQFVEESRALASELGVTEAQAFARLFESRDGRVRTLAKAYRTRP